MFLVELTNSICVLFSSTFGKDRYWSEEVHNAIKALWLDKANSSAAKEKRNPSVSTGAATTVLRAKDTTVFPNGVRNLLLGSLRKSKLTAWKQVARDMNCENVLEFNTPANLCAVPDIAELDIHVDPSTWIADSQVLDCIHLKDRQKWKVGSKLPT
ncbi:hypothetical protein R1sor_010513 [Riccia sorocarpa]|uniref:Uncharacterized protein n=1 Tax=Riccia sorocarpa TaxID=122646 RepID=A0ABD3HY89_9MARC